MADRLSLVRATHLNDYISVLRRIGAPVDRDLAQSKLPPRVEETPDLYVSIPVAIEWIARSGRDLDAMVAQLRGKGIEVEVDPETYPNGRFASTKDPEGNPIQLWQEEGE